MIHQSVQGNTHDHQSVGCRWPGRNALTFVFLALCQVLVYENMKTTIVCWHLSIHDMSEWHERDCCAPLPVLPIAITATVTHIMWGTKQNPQLCQSNRRLGLSLNLVIAVLLPAVGIEHTSRFQRTF